MPAGIYVPPILAPLQLSVAGNIPWATGRFYGTPCKAAALGTLTMSGFRCCPIFVPNPAGVIVTSIGIEVTTFSACNQRLGIYDIDEVGAPGKLILDAGTVSLGSSNGFKSISSLSQFLKPGWYWIVGVHDSSTTVVVRAHTADFCFFGCIDEQDSSGSPLSHWDRVGGGTNTPFAMYNDGLSKSLSGLLKPSTGSHPRYMVGI